MTIASTRISLSSHFLLLVLALCVMPPAHAQQQTQTPIYVPSPTGIDRSGDVSVSSGSLERQMAEKMAIERNKQRQEKIVSDSAKLLALAQKLNSDVAKSNKDQLSVAVVKEAEEIEKLAKSIKSKMSYGY
jgi:hypothetical protein